MRVAIWSMKAPVPPAQEPFIRSSSAPPKKMILASSPPSSMTASVSGMYWLTAAAVAYTSCTKSISAALATPRPAEPVMTMRTCRPASRSARERRVSAARSRALE